MTLGNSKSNGRKSGSRSGSKRGSRSGTRSASRSGSKRGSRSGKRRGSRSGTRRGSRSGSKSGNRKKKKTHKKASMSKKTKGVKKIINNLKKFKTTQQLDKMIKNYEQKKSKGSKSLFYLTDYDKKTGKFKGDQVSMSEFIRRIKKINKADFIRQCKAISKNKKGGQFGGGISASFFMMFINITLAIAVLYVLCTGSAAQVSIASGFGALIRGSCNSFSELSFRYIGLGNPICNAWSSATTTLLLGVTGNPTALAKITGLTVMIMKSPQWVPRLHCAFMVKIAEVCVLGDLMETEELDVLKNMYTPYGRRLGGIEDEGDGPEFEVLGDE